MTSLIDVIFLLLLFFMLSSTFSRFAEVEITAGGGGGTSDQAADTLLFLRVSEDRLTLNGDLLSADALEDHLAEIEEATLIVSVADSTPAQLLVDILVLTRNFQSLNVSVLDASS
ncbi:MAG: biopolymer transporter ExbD [Pseudomonadota bacterium]